MYEIQLVTDCSGVMSKLVWAKDPAHHAGQQIHHSMPRWTVMLMTEIMPLGHRKLLKDDLNGDMAGTAKEGVLQRLQLSKRDNGCMSWGPDFTALTLKLTQCASIHTWLV